MARPTKRPAAGIPPSVFRAEVPPTVLDDETDAFGHRDYAATIASVLAEAEPPFTLGLFGPWGLGKTTIIEEVGRRLPQDCAFAVFDAWRYEGDALRRHFLGEVSRQLLKSQELDDAYDREKELEELTTPVSSVRPAGWSVSRVNLLRAIINSLLVGGFVFAVMKFGLSLRASTLGAFASALVALALFVVTPLTQILDVKFETVTRPRVEDPERFTEKFESLLGHLKRRRLVVAIDNVDRCGPERIEKIFDTLNTYLEPAGTAGRAQGVSPLLAKKRAKGEIKEAVFLVAADDEALRCHLEAREAKASLTSDNPRPSREDIGRYADEYLRKIFKASIPIKPLLDGDMRAYVNRELDRFVREHPLASEERRRLVEVIARALKRNPRRVRQFVHNLELRLRLISTRETSGAIAAELSKEVLLVAKLTLLEEEWPRSFALLVSDPRILDDWHAKQTSDDLNEIPDGSDPSFRSFLSASRGIRSEHLPAFLSLKQSREELDLPRFEEFRAALLQGDAAAVFDVLANVDETTIRRYADHLLPMLRKEIESGYLDAARSIVETAAADAKLSTENATLELLTEAARDNRLRHELRLANPEPLLLVGQHLPEENFALLVQPFTDLASFYSEGKARLFDVASALAEVAERLPEHSRIAITESIRSSDLIDDFVDYLPLVERVPTLLPNEAGVKALEAFTSDFNTDGPAFQIIQLLLGQDPPTELQDRFLTIAIERIANRLNAGDAGTDLEEEASALAAVAQMLRRPTTNAINTALSNLESIIPQSITVGIGYQVLDLVAVCAELPSDVEPSRIGQLVQIAVGQNPDVLIAYVLNRGSAIGPNMTSSLLPALSQLANGGHPIERQEQAASAILAISPNDEGGHLTGAVQRAAAQGDFPSVETHLDHHPVVLEKTSSLIIESLLAHAEAMSVDAAPAFPTLYRLVTVMSEDDRARLRDLLRQMIIASSISLDPIAAVLQQAEEEPSFAHQYELLVRDVWDHLKSQPDPPQNLFHYVAKRFSRLDSDRRAAFITQFGIWIIQLRHTRLSLPQLLEAIPDLKALEQAQLVEKIIEVERIEGDINTRASLLQAARNIEGGPRRVAAKRLKARLTALEGSDSVDDQQVSQLLATN